MAETKTITFTYRELAEILVRQQDQHEGHWGVFFEFAIAGGMVPFPPGSDSIVPAAIVPINKIGIQRFDDSNAFTVDAAVVNPRVATPS
jgi:hypothetical protein